MSLRWKKVPPTESSKPAITLDGFFTVTCTPHPPRATRPARALHDNARYAEGFPKLGKGHQ